MLKLPIAAMIAFDLILEILHLLIFKSHINVLSVNAPSWICPRVVLNIITDDISAALKASVCKSPIWELWNIMLARDFRKTSFGTWGMATLSKVIWKKPCRLIIFAYLCCFYNGHWSMPSCGALMFKIKRPFEKIQLFYVSEWTAI